MNKQEMSVVMMILETAYPRFYADNSKDEKKAALDLWTAMFASNDANVVKEAVKAMIATLKYPPTIADVKDKVRLITKPETMTEIEAWNLVYGAIQNANYYAQECFDRLPLVLQKLVGSPNQLREWGMMDIGVISSVIQSNFMRSYATRVKNEEQIEALPDSAKSLMSKISKGFEMLKVKNYELHG